MATKTKNKKNVQVIEENVEAVENTGRQAVRAYMGLLSMVYDESKELLERAQTLLNKAEQRGQEVEEQTRQEAEKFYKQAEEQITQIRERFNRRASKAETEAEEEVEAQIERLLKQMGVPTRKEIVDLGNRIDELTAAIDKQILGTDADAAVEAPLPNYDTLTVREINDQLDGLTISELVAIKQYEMAHDNRVTVLREVNRRIKEMPIARYDALTVDEVEPLLTDLNADDLKYLKQYEQAHENRVTMIEAIERELNERQPVTA